MEFWGKLKRSRLFKIFLFFLAFILFVILMDNVIMPYYVHLGHEMELPDVVEKSVEEAQKELENQGFSVIIADSVYDALFPKGIVVEQMPLPYSTVKKGRHVYLTISIGEKPIIMPNLFYISPRDAELILQSYGLELKSKYYEYSDISPEGVVIAQSYPQGQKVKKSTKIQITISLGPFPELKTIPELVGKSLGAVKKQLRTLGVSDIIIEYEERANILPETVLKQSIDPGTPIEENMIIELLVSKMEQIKED